LIFDANSLAGRVAPELARHRAIRAASFRLALAEKLGSDTLRIPDPE
jgi:hypothetical protein